MNVDCEAIRGKIKEKIEHLQADIDDIEHDMDSSTSTPMEMYMMLDDLQDMHDYLVVAKMFGCLRS